MFLANSTFSQKPFNKNGYKLSISFNVFKGSIKLEWYEIPGKYLVCVVFDSYRNAMWDTRIMKYDDIFGPGRFSSVVKIEIFFREENSMHQ